MKSVALSLLVLASAPAFADFFDSLDSLFRNQNLCEASDEQVLAEGQFRAWLEMLKLDVQAGTTSIYEVTEDAVYASEITNTETGVSCQIIRHDDCYSASCL